MIPPQMLDQLSSKPGFIAALDQSGGSTPGALKLYGVSESQYHDDDGRSDQSNQQSGVQSAAPARFSRGRRPRRRWRSSGCRAGR